MAAKNGGGPRRLLYIANDAAFFVSHRLLLAQAAAKAGFEVHVATPLTLDNEALGREFMVHHVLSMRRRSINPFREVHSLFEMIRLCRRLQPQVVHTVTTKAVIYGGMAARLTGVPVVVNELSGLGFVFVSTGMKGVLLRALLAPAYRFACRHKRSRIICQNADDLAELTRWGLIEPANAVVVRGSCVDLGRFRPRPESEGVPIVVLPSRMLRDKGVVEFVEAARILRSEGVEARFVLVGDTDRGNPAAINRKELTGWDRDGSVEWWGFRPDMPEVLRQAHVVCLPSYREGSPRVLIEGAAAGRALVASDVPGCRDVVRHGENGLLVPVRDARALATGLRSVIENRTLRVRMGQHGSALVRREFGADSVVSQTLPLYASDGVAQACQHTEVRS